MLSGPGQGSQEAQEVPCQADLDYTMVSGCAVGEERKYMHGYTYHGIEKSYFGLVIYSSLRQVDVFCIEETIHSSIGESNMRVGSIFLRRGCESAARHPSSDCHELLRPASRQCDMLTIGLGVDVLTGSLLVRAARPMTPLRPQSTIGSTMSSAG